MNLAATDVSENRPKGLTATALINVAVIIMIAGSSIIEPRKSFYEGLILVIHATWLLILYYYWKGQNWARILILIGSCSNVVAPFVVGFDGTWVSNFVLTNGIFSGFLLYWLNRADVRRFFSHQGTCLDKQTPLPVRCLCFVIVGVGFVRWLLSICTSLCVTQYASGTWEKPKANQTQNAACRSMEDYIYREASKLAHTKGLAKQSKGDLDGALIAYNRAIELDPKSAPAYTSRASIKEKKRDFDGALSDISSAIELAQKNSISYGFRGFLKGNKGDVRGALADFECAIQLDPKLADAYNCSAWLLATTSDDSLRNGAKALKYATRACELTDWKNATDIETFAAACAETGDYDQAVKWQSRYVELNPSKMAAQSRLGLYKNHQPYHKTK